MITRRDARARPPEIPSMSDPILHEQLRQLRDAERAASLEKKRIEEEGISKALFGAREGHPWVRNAPVVRPQVTVERQEPAVLVVHVVHPEPIETPVLVARVVQSEPVSSPTLNGRVAPSVQLRLRETLIEHIAFDRSPGR